MTNSSANIINKNDIFKIRRYLRRSKFPLLHYSIYSSGAISFKIHLFYTSFCKQKSHLQIDRFRVSNITFYRYKKAIESASFYLQLNFIGVSDKKDAFTDRLCLQVPISATRRKSYTQSVLIADHGAAGFGRRIRAHRQGAHPLPLGQVQAPEVVERGHGAGAAPEDVHGVVVDGGRVRVALGDGGRHVRGRDRLPRDVEVRDRPVQAPALRPRHVWTKDLNIGRA